MAKSEEFGRLLSEAIHTLKEHQGKSIAIVQDELGYALGRKGGSAIEYWRSGALPANLTVIEKLSQLLQLPI